MKDLNKLSQEERETVIARREYQRAWRARNKDKVKASNARFYKKHAKTIAANKPKEKPSE